MSYVVIFTVLLTACVQKIFTSTRPLSPEVVASQFSFAFDGTFADVQTVVVNFAPAQFKLASLTVLRAKFTVNTSDQICEHAQAFKLQTHNTVGKLTCRAAPLHHSTTKDFADKLYFFPRGAYCQVGRLLREAGNSYEVEFCGVRNTGGGFHDCVAGNTSNLKSEQVTQHNFAVKQAAYPFDPLTTLQITHTVQVREKHSLWRTRRVTLNGNGVLTTGHSCLFRDGCQVRVDPHDGKCVAPSPP